MPSPSPVTRTELVFQLLLHLVVFVFFAFDRTSPGVEPFEVVYFVQYALATLLISYGLLPRYFYRHRYLAFALGVVVILTAVIALEETVLESIFFPGQRAATFGGIFFSLAQILPIMVILSAGKFAWDAAVGRREVQELRSLMRESELNFLKSQLNPHFLFNNLNNLYAYAIEQSPKTPEIILELSAVLRYMIYDCRRRYVPLSRELEQLRNFTRLYELQVEERGDVTFAAPSGGEGYAIAPLILLVFIENAFKHGQAGQADNVRIAIEADLSPTGELVFVCSNDYVPTRHESDGDGGIGLANARKRLELLYAENHDLHIVDDGATYSVRLRLQLSKSPSV